MTCAAVMVLFFDLMILLLLEACAPPTPKVNVFSLVQVSGQSTPTVAPAAGATAERLVVQELEASGE